MTAQWEFWIDRGGTFTDVVGRRADGTLVTHKLLSDNPKRYDDAAIAGIRQVLRLGEADPIPVHDIAAVKMGTTVATNALLERTGEPTVLVTTRGFADALRIGYQNRPRIFVRHIELPEVLHTAVVEADERLDAQGEVVTPLDAGTLRSELEAAFARGFRSVAVVLMHSFRDPAHERAIGELARSIGFTQVSLSHEVSPLMKLVSRGDTTVVDAYLSPILRRYVDHVSGALPGVHCQFMRSSGGLTEAHHFRGKDAILSGPAGGIVGMARTAQAAGVSRVIGFDMGGTSTDVSHFAGEFEREYDTYVAGVRVRAPIMSIHTVAAGGGSILQFDGQRYRVGGGGGGGAPPAPRRTATAGRSPSPTPTSCSAGSSPRTSLRSSATAGRSRWTARGWCWPSGSWPSGSVTVAHRRRWPPGSCGSRSTTWRRRSRRSRCSAGTTSPATPSPRSAGRAASTPAPSPTRSG